LPRLGSSVRIASPAPISSGEIKHLDQGHQMVALSVFLLVNTRHDQIRTNQPGRFVASSDAGRFTGRY